jgi:hypothetical protein
MSPQEKEKIRELLLQSRPDGVGEIYDRIGQKIYHTILGILRTETAGEQGSSGRC